MSKLITYLVAIIFLTALNVVFPSLRGGSPNFLFLLVVIYAFRQDQPDFLWLAFCAGLFLDSYSNVFFGTYTLSFLIISALINYMTRTLFSAEPSLPYIASMIAVSNLVLIGLVYFINSIGIHMDKSILPLSGEYLGAKIWGDVMLNLIFAAPVYYLAIWLDRVVTHFQTKEQTL